MNKQQAEEYYEQLKKTDKAANMNLSEVIHILTSGSISVQKSQQFINHVLSNEFGQYGQIYEHVQKKDWKSMPFSKVYQVLKYLKMYIKKKKGKQLERSESQRSEKGGLKDQLSSFDSKHPNNTVQEILMSLKGKQSPRQQGQSKKDKQKFNEDMFYEQNWKAMKFKLVKKLLVVFDYLRKSMHIEGESFDKNKLISENMDLTMFMKYIKLFDLTSTFKTHRIIKAFKDNAVNTIWVDFDRFVNANFSIIGFKQSITIKEKYLRLKGLHDLIKSEEMKKMLNIRVKSVLATIVEGHTGTYKQDILDFLHQKYEERKKREVQRYKGKRMKTETHRSVVTNKGGYSVERKVVKSQSTSKITSRIKTQQAPSVYKQLKLPQLRIKEHKDQSIYESLKALDVSSEKQKLKQLVHYSENEEYLDQYLKEQAKAAEKKKNKKTTKIFQLPPMKFS